jgi:predicted ATP-grasp superfamily ATP-dependent carboligase
LNMDEHKLMQALSDCAAHCQQVAQQLCVITGTGFESQLDMLRRLQQEAQSLGAVCAFNEADVVSELADPQVFFAALEALGADYPLTQLTPPISPKPWWIKQRGGHGACHVRPYTKDVCKPTEIDDISIYYQEDIIGSAYSISANSSIDSIVCLQFNQQQIVNLPQGGMQYQGALAVRQADAMQTWDISPQQQQALIELTQALCKCFKVRGLLSLDFILSDDGKAYVLEVNARPTATFELLDGASALALHLQAFGVLPELPERAWQDRQTPKCAGHRYVFAPQTVKITTKMERLLTQHGVMQHVSDWPMPNTTVPAHAPLCNLHAQAHAPGAVQALLDSTERQLLQCLLNETHPLRMAA